MSDFANLPQFNKFNQSKFGSMSMNPDKMMKMMDFNKDGEMDMMEMMMGSMMMSNPLMMAMMMKNGGAEESSDKSKQTIDDVIGDIKSSSDYSSKDGAVQDVKTPEIKHLSKSERKELEQELLTPEQVVNNSATRANDFTIAGVDYPDAKGHKYNPEARQHLEDTNIITDKGIQKDVLAERVENEEGVITNGNTQGLSVEDAKENLKSINSEIADKKYNDETGALNLGEVSYSVNVGDANSDGVQESSKVDLQELGIIDNGQIDMKQAKKQLRQIRKESGNKSNLTELKDQRDKLVKQRETAKHKNADTTGLDGQISKLTDHIALQSVVDGEGVSASSTVGDETVDLEYDSKTGEVSSNAAYAKAQLGAGKYDAYKAQGLINEDGSLNKDAIDKQGDAKTKLDLYSTVNEAITDTDDNNIAEGVKFRGQSGKVSEAGGITDATKTALVDEAQASFKAAKAEKINISGVSSESLAKALTINKDGTGEIDMRKLSPKDRKEALRGGININGLSGVEFVGLDGDNPYVINAGDEVKFINTGSDANVVINSDSDELQVQAGKDSNIALGDIASKQLVIKGAQGASLSSDGMNSTNLEAFKAQNIDLATDMNINSNSSNGVVANFENVKGGKNVNINSANGDSIVKTSNSELGNMGLSGQNVKYTASGGKLGNVDAKATANEGDIALRLFKGAKMGAATLNGGGDANVALNNGSISSLNMESVGGRTQTFIGDGVDLASGDFHVTGDKAEEGQTPDNLVVFENKEDKAEFTSDKVNKEMLSSGNHQEVYEKFFDVTETDYEKMQSNLLSGRGNYESYGWGATPGAGRSGGFLLGLEKFLYGFAMSYNNPMMYNGMNGMYGNPYNSMYNQQYMMQNPYMGGYC